MLETDCDRNTINELEIEYIKKYDSFVNGFNLNEGGSQNNGFKSRFTREDILNILKGASYQDIKLLYDNIDKQKKDIIYKNAMEYFDFNGSAYRDIC